MLHAVSSTNSNYYILSYLNPYLCWSIPRSSHSFNYNLITPNWHTRWSLLHMSKSLIVNQWLPIMLQLMLRLILTGKLISYLVFHHIAVCFDYSYFRDMFFHCPTFRSTNNASHVAYAFPSISQVIWIMSPVYPFCFNSMKISFNFTIIFFIWDSPCKLGVIW